MRAAGPSARPALALLLLLAGAGVLAAAAAPLAPPLFNVSLDAAPQLRWLPVLQHYDRDFLHSAMAHIIGDYVPQWVLALIRKVVPELELLLPQPFADEIRGMCDALDFNLVDCILLNLAYEFSAFCTSIVAQDSKGHIYHGRNLDYVFGSFLRNLTLDVQFIKNGQIAYTGTTFVGYVGLWTGQSPHKFTVSGDERDKGWWWENMIAALFQRHSPVSWLIRTTLSESENFEAAVYKLAKTPLIADVYYIVGGTSPKEGVVITRNRGGPADIWPLDPLNGAWFRVETNYDHWKPVPKADDRRTPAIKALNATGQANLSLETLFQNAEKAFRAAALIQRWYRRYVARLEMRRRCTWSIFQSIEYAGQQDQVKLHNFFSYLVDHFTPSSHNERDFLNRIFTEERSPQASETQNCGDYDSIEVPDSYTGPRLSFPLLPDHATALVEAFRRKQRLHARYVLNLLHEARKHLVQLPNINQVSTCYSEEITVCGDLHGQLDDLIFIFYKNGLPSPERAYVFNGDFVDRGKDSVEILMVLFAFMLVYPKEFHLNRGNHEDHIVNLRYGFTKEVMHKYKIHGKKILKLLQDVFCWLPLATLVDEKVLILHGGVSDRTDLELLAKLDRHKIVSTMRYKTRKENKKQAEEKGNANQTGSAGRPSPWFLPQSRSLPSSPLRPSTHKAHRAGRSSSVPCGVPLDPKELSRRVRRSVDLELERCRQQAGFPAIKEKEEPSSSESEVDSDAEEQPQPTPEEWRQVVDILWSDPMAQEGCRANTVRGGGCYFGPNVTERLLQKYHLQFLIRSHECKPEGYEFCHSRKVLTIFSASNYYEVGSNRGAYVKLGPDLTPHIMQFQANKATHTLTMRQRISRVEESALRALREKLFAHSSDILVEFKKHDKDETGLIALSDWAAAVESVLHLGLPWRMLRPQLVSSLTDNKLAYKSWLENLAKEKLSQQNIQSSLLETLYRNRSNLETIFRIIDSDHSGSISLDEFRHTWKLFSSHMNIDITDDCICDLARSIDFNKDGHIDINEFLEAFRLVEQSCSGGDVSDCPQVTNSSNRDCSSPGAH